MVSFRRVCCSASSLRGATPGALLGGFKLVLARVNFVANAPVRIHWNTTESVHTNGDHLCNFAGITALGRLLSFWFLVMKMRTFLLFALSMSMQSNGALTSADTILFMQILIQFIKPSGSSTKWLSCITLPYLGSSMLHSFAIRS